MLEHRERGTAPISKEADLSAASTVAEAGEPAGPSMLPQPDPPVDQAGEAHEPPPNPSQRRIRVGVEQLAWLAAILVAALIRLPALGLLPLSLSDSSRAFAAWQVAGGHLPDTWSGDLGQTLTAAVFKLAGDGDGPARIVSALLGVGLVAVLRLYRPFVGRAAAILAAFFIALSPTCVAVSRSLSPYAAGALFAVAAGALLLTFIEAPRPAPLAWLAGILGLGVSTDASFIVFVLAGVLFCVIEGLWRRRPEFRPAGVFLQARASLLRSALLIGLAGLIVATTRFGIAPERLRSGAAFSWTQAFTPTSGTAPWHFPLDALLGYEPFLFVAGVAVAVYLILHTRRTEISLAERLLLYWAMAALVFILVAARKDAGQIPLLLVPLALLAAAGCVRCLGTLRWDLIRQAVAPSLLAFPAFVYVLLVLESTTINTQLPVGQQVSLMILLVAGMGLVILGAIWAHQSAPAYLTLCGLLMAVMFSLHTVTRVGFGGGDEFLVGPVATADAPALGDALAQVAPTLRGPITVDRSLAVPLEWYTRDVATVRLQAATAASAAIVQTVDRAQPPGFSPLVARSEIARTWYPASVSAQGIIRWLLYRQAWEPVRSTSVQVLVRSGQP